MLPLQGKIFSIGQGLMLAISLVAGGDDNSLDEFAVAAARFEQIIGAPNIGLKSGEGIAVGGADNGLGRNMKNRLNFILVQHPLKCLIVFQFPTDNAHPVLQTEAVEVRIWHQVTDKTRDIGTFVDQPFCQPGAKQTGATGYKDISISPEAV